jgi:hypothetical protein
MAGKAPGSGVMVQFEIVCGFSGVTSAESTCGRNEFASAVCSCSSIQRTRRPSFSARGRFWEDSATALVLPRNEEKRPPRLRFRVARYRGPIGNKGKPAGWGSNGRDAAVEAGGTT